MGSTRRDYSCNYINGSTRISRPDMTKMGLEGSLLITIGGDRQCYISTNLAVRVDMSK